jgi:hypothetical protein
VCCALSTRHCVALEKRASRVPTNALRKTGVCCGMRFIHTSVDMQLRRYTKASAHACAQMRVHVYVHFGS